MTRTLTKREKIAFIESLDELSEYEKRLLLSEIEKMDTLDEIIDYIDEIYQNSYKAVTGHLQAFSEKYSQDGKLTILMASALLTLGEKRDLQKQVAAFNKKHPKLEQPITLPEKPTRLDGLKTEVTMTMAEATEKINDKIDTHLKRTYQETYLTRTFEHAKATVKQPEIKPERLEEEIIDEIISRTFQNKRFSQRIWGANQERLVNRVESLVRGDLANSLPPDDSSKVLATEFNVARNRAVTVLQTETNNIQAEATKAEYSDDNVKKYKYLATLEAHTCEICGDLDSKIFNVKDAVRGVNYPTMHPHCRCTTVPAIEDIGGRSAKDVDTGKTYTVKRGTTYQEWRKQQLEKYGITAIEDKLRAERLEKQRVARTKLQFLEYRQLLGKDALPKTFAEFYDLKYNNSEKWLEIKDRLKWLKAGFPSEKSLNGHYETHGKEFEGLTKKEYQQLASWLLSQPESKNILGYQVTERRVRYDIENNIYVLGNTNKHKIVTMFKPDEGRDYYVREVKKDVDT